MTFYDFTLLFVAGLELFGYGCHLVNIKQDMQIKFKERARYPYIHTFADNHVVLFMPLAASDANIATDNTCQAFMELKEFFSPQGALAALREMQNDLRFDIRLIGELKMAVYESLLEDKESRLKQITDQLQLFELMRLDSSIQQMYGQRYAVLPSILLPLFTRSISEGGTLCSMQLCPSMEDSWLRAPNVIFSLTRASINGVKSPFYYLLTSLDYPATIVLRDRVLLDFEKECAWFYHNLDQSLEDLLDRLKNTSYLKGISWPHINETDIESAACLSQDETVRDCYETPRLLAEFLLASFNIDWDMLNDQYDYGLIHSPKGDDLERFSQMIQFYMGVINIYLFARGVCDINMGPVLESDVVCYDFGVMLTEAVRLGKNVEMEILDFVSEKKDLFKLTRALDGVEKRQIREQFRQQYLVIKDSPHFDEFMLIDSQEQPSGWVQWQNRQVCPFMTVVNTCFHHFSDAHTRRAESMIGAMAPSVVDFLKDHSKISNELFEVDLRILVSLGDESFIIDHLPKEAISLVPAGSEHSTLISVVDRGMQKLALGLLSISSFSEQAHIDRNELLFRACMEGMSELAAQLISIPQVREHVHEMDNRILWAACQMGLRDIVLSLLDLSSVRDAHFQAPHDMLTFAIMRQMEDVALQLLRVSQVIGSCHLGDNILLVEACKNGMAIIAIELLKHEEVRRNAHAFNNMALRQACKNKLIGVVQALLACDGVKSSAGVMNNSALQITLIKNMPEVALALLQLEDVRVHIYGLAGQALRLACECRMISVVLSLLDLPEVIALFEEVDQSSGMAYRDSVLMLDDDLVLVKLLQNLQSNRLAFLLAMSPQTQQRLILRQDFRVLLLELQSELSNVTEEGDEFSRLNFLGILRDSPGHLMFSEVSSETLREEAGSRLSRW